MNLPPQDRYVYKPFYGSSHWWAKRYFGSLAKDASVLDVGPGSSSLGKELLSLGVSNIYAVEIDELAREHAAKTYREVADSVSHFSGKSFDLILLLDVLEHTAEPSKLLEEVSSLLRPGGVLLISLPNVAHLSVRLSLMLGYFEYTARGILDRTHLQFFTRRRMLQMLRGQKDLQIVEFTASIEPLELMLPQFVWDNRVFEALSRMRRAVAHLWPGPFAYQLLAAMRKGYSHG